MSLRTMAWWLRQHLTQLIWPRPTHHTLPPPSDLGTLQLPAELLLMIASHLDGLSATFLALTCRDLYSLLRPDRVTLDTAEKTQLLLWVEPKTPHFYFCHACVKLHRWRGRGSNAILSEVCKHLPRTFNEGQLHISPFVRVAFSHARLIMNRHFWGENHGPLPSTLNKASTTKLCFYFPEVMVSSGRDTRIVDGQLLVRKTMSFSHPKGDIKMFRKSIEESFTDLCWHLSVAERTYDFYAQLPELATKGDTPDSFQPCDNSVGSCPFCQTDYSINISPPRKNTSQVIDIFIYRQLGSCRTPLDWSWLTLANAATAESFRIELDEAYYGPGTIRNRWHTDDDGADIADAAWVEMYHELARMSRFRAWQRTGIEMYSMTRGEVAQLFQ